MLNPAPADKNQEQIIPCQEGGVTGCVSDYFGRVNLESCHPTNAAGKNSANQCGGAKRRRGRKNKSKGKRKQRGGAYYGFSGGVNKVAKGTYGTYAVETAGNHCARGLDTSNLGASGYNAPVPVGQSVGFAASEQAIFSENSLPGVAKPNGQQGGYSNKLDGYNYPAPGMVNNTGVQDPDKMYGNPLLNGSASPNTTNYVAMEPGPENSKFHGSGYPQAASKQRGGARKSRKVSKKQSKRGRKTMKKRKSQRKHGKHMKKSGHKSMKKHNKRKHGRKSMKKHKKRKVQRGGSGMQPLSPHTFNEVASDTTQQIKGDGAPPSQPAWADMPGGSGYAIGGKSLVEGKSWMGTSPGPHTTQNGVGKGGCVNNYNHYTMKDSVVKSNN